MEIGGAERSLLGLLNSIDTSVYDVDLFVYSHRGEFMPMIPSKINLLPENKKYASLEKPITNVIKSGFIDIALARLVAKVMDRLYVKKEKVANSASIYQYIADCTTPFLPSLYKLGEYDIAISFLTPHNIVLNKVRAKKKLAWIHTDYSYIKINKKIELPVWEKFDYIVSISDAVTVAFVKTFPELEKKIILIENILSVPFIRQQAEGFDASTEMNVPSDAIRLCSVGRFTDAKNFDNAPWILKRIRENGINAYWFIVGYGGEENTIKEQIHLSGMGDYFILLGKKENPYPYIKCCDVYVQPSRYEGKSVTVREAQILCKPVIITNFATATSQINNGVDGAIVPMDNDSCANAISDILRNKSLMQSWIDNMEKTNYGNESEVSKLYDLIDSK